MSGQTSDQIAARQGGAPAKLTFPGNSMPGSGRVILQDQSTFPITPDGPGPIPGTVAGFHGTLSFLEDTMGNWKLAFTRDTAGQAETIPAATPFNPDTAGRREHVNVFWMGQNNFEEPAQVKSDIAKSIAFLTTQKFIVIGMTNTSTEPRGTDHYNLKVQLNGDLARLYPSNFIDIRRVLIDSYDPAIAQDVTDRSNDVPPSSLRNDEEHLNDRGYGIVAREVAEMIQAKGW